MPLEIKAGPLAFNVESGGKEEHAFVIEDNGVPRQTPVISRGSTAASELTLTPGTYTVWCPVKDHKAKGMRLFVRCDVVML